MMRYTTDKKYARGRLARTLVALLAAGFVLMAASSAFALDNYADRKGLFFGLGLGGGVGGVDLAEGEGQVGFEDGRLPGFHLNAMLGGGVNSNIVLGAQYNWWGRSIDKQYENSSLESFHHHSNLLAAGNFFLIEGLYIDLGAGMAYSTFESTRGGDQRQNHQEMGFAVKGGLGFEYFVNGTHAIGFNAGYTRHFYDLASFDTFNGGISIRWY